MTFPYNGQGQLISQQGILGGVASANAGTPVLMVSTTNSITATITPLSADSSKVSALQGDAGLLRVSAIGGTAGDRTIVDGTTQTISATLTPISANPAGTVAGLVVNAKSYDAGVFRVSTVGGTTGDHTLVDGTTQTISATLTPISASPAGTVAGLVVNSFQADAGKQLVSAKQGDAGLLRASAVQSDGSNLRVSSVQPDAGLQHVSAFVDSGSVSAKSGDANQVHVSAVQGDAGLLRISSFGSVVTTNTGGASLYFTSTATNSQVSTVKSTAGRLYGYHLGNPAGVDQYVQIFNASGGAQAGTDAPTLSLYVPTLGGAVMSLGDGIGFSNGIQFITTSTVAGSTVGASGVRVNFFYA